MALAGHRVLLIDLDTYAPSMADFLGSTERSPGLSAAARLVGQGRFDLDQIDRLAIQFSAGAGKLAVLPGLRSSARWPEITRERIEGLLDEAMRHFDFVVMDVASPLEVAIRQVGGAVDRNVAARSALEISTKTIALLAADPVGAKRFLDAFDHVLSLSKNVQIVVNRLRSSALGAKPRQQIDDLVKTAFQREIAATIPSDSEACDKALFEMVPLAMMKRSSPARQAIAQFTRLNFLADKEHMRLRVAKLD